MLHHSSRTKTIDLVKEVVQSWGETVSNAWQSITSNRWLVNIVTLAMFAIGLSVCRRLKVNVLVVAVSVVAFYTFQFLDAECQRVSDSVVLWYAFIRLICFYSRTLRLNVLPSYWSRINRIRAEVVMRTGGIICSAARVKIVNDTWGKLEVEPSAKPILNRFHNRKTFERTCTIKDIYDGFFQAFVYGQMSLFLESLAGITSKINCKSNLASFDRFDLIPTYLLQQSTESWQRS